MLTTALQNRTFAALWSAQVVALLGTGLLTVALGLLAYDLAGGDAGIVLGIALTIKMVAYVAIAPTMTALTSAIPRRTLLISADAVRAGVALCLPFVTEAWHIYPLIFILQAASATFTPAFQAVLPTVLPDEREYTKAVALSRLAYDLEALISPIFAAILLTITGYHNLFIGTAMGFIGSAWLVWRATLPTQDAPPPARFVDRLTRGVLVFWRTPTLRALLALNLTVAAGLGMVLVNTPVIVQHHLGRPELDVAILFAASGFGSMLIALNLDRITQHYTDRHVMLTGAITTPCALLATSWVLHNAAATASWYLLLGLWFVLGAAGSAIMTPAARLIRRHSTDSDQPAVFAAQFSLSHACFMITYPLAGLLGANTRLSIAALGLAVLGVVGAQLAWWAWPAVATKRHSHT